MKISKNVWELKIGHRKKTLMVMHMVTADCFLVLCTGKLKTDFTEHLNLLSKIESFITLRPGPEVIKLLSCSIQMSMGFIMLINVKMPTIVGILTFISMINTRFNVYLWAFYFL